MEPETIASLIVALLIFLVVLSIFKSLLKAGIFAVIVVVLFRVGWIYTSDDLKEKLHLDNFISKEYQEIIFRKYDEFVEKRKGGEIIDTDKINDTINDNLNKLNEKVDEYIEKAKELVK